MRKILFGEETFKSIELSIGITNRLFRNQSWKNPQLIPLTNDKR